MYKSVRCTGVRPLQPLPHLADEGVYVYVCMCICVCVCPCFVVCPPISRSRLKNPSLQIFIFLIGFRGRTTYKTPVVQWGRSGLVKRPVLAWRSLFGVFYKYGQKFTPLYIATTILQDNHTNFYPEWVYICWINYIYMYVCVYVYIATPTSQQ